jgi:hypothetical protein
MGAFPDATSRAKEFSWARSIACARADSRGQTVAPPQSGMIVTVCQVVLR